MWIDDKPCPRCHSLDRDGDSEREVCAPCGLVYYARHWYDIEAGREYDDDLDAEIRRYGWSRLRTQNNALAATSAAL